MRPSLAAPAVLALTAALTAVLWAAPAQAKEPEAVLLDASADAAQLVKPSQHLDAVKGLQRVALTQFSIEFVTQDSVSSQTSGFASAGRARVTGNYKLVGVAEPEFQALADQLRAHVLAQLAAQGLAVVPPEQVAAAPTWQRLVAAGTPLPQRMDAAVVVGPAGAALYGTQKMHTAAAGQKGLFAAVAQLGTAGEALNVGFDNMALQKELGDAAVMEISLRVHFAQLADESKGFFGRMGSSAKISAKTHPIVQRATLNVQRGSLGSLLSIEAPLLLDPSAFTEVREPAATKGEIAGAIAVGLLRAAIGSKDSVSHQQFEVLADPAVYRERVGAGLQQTLGLLLTRLNAAR